MAYASFLSPSQRIFEQEQQYIYHIIVDKTYIYIGKTTTGDRLEQHFMNAYTGSNKHAIYQYMRNTTMSKISVYTFPLSKNFGLPQTAYAEFSYRDWKETQPKQPYFTDKNGKQVSLINFAELYHIIWRVSQGQYTITNKECGGSGSYAIDGKILFTSKTDPKTAYDILRTANNQRRKNAAGLTSKIYKAIFDPQWPNSIKTYLGDLITSSSAIPPKDTWGEFVQKEVAPLLTKENNGKELYDLKHNAASSKLSKDLKKVILDNFFLPREQYFKKVLNGVEVDLDIPNMLDLSPLTDYFHKIISNMVQDGKIVQEFETVSKRLGIHKVKKSMASGTSTFDAQNIQRLTLIIPVATDLIWKKLNTEAHSIPWMRFAPNGRKIGDIPLRQMSLRYFNYVLNNKVAHASLQDAITLLQDQQLKGVNKKQREKAVNKTMSLKQSHNDFESIAQGTPFYYLQNAFRNSTLSNQMKKYYNAYAHGYIEDWENFYRGTVSAWRRIIGLSPMQVTTINKKYYAFYMLPGINAYGVYSNDTINAWEINRDWKNLRIY